MASSSNVTYELSNPPTSIQRFPLLSSGQEPIQSFDRSVFAKTVPLLALKVPPAKVSSHMKKFSNKFLQVSTTKFIAKESKYDPYRLLLLPTDNEDQVDPVIHQAIKDDNDLSLVQHEVSLDYSNWSYEQVINALLPIELLKESPTSYSLVGHIAHFNIMPEFMPYRFLVGQIILDKQKNVQTVVNKLDTIDHKFRFFNMEILAGKPDFNVTVSSKGCRFKFDFSKVYWNTRLSSEHERLVDEIFKPQDLIVDAFAGVGPFAVPAGKKGCAVLASDLNPSSASAMQENVKLNKVENMVKTWNEDARKFIPMAVEYAWNNPLPGYSPSKSIRQQVREERRKRQKLDHDSEGKQKNNDIMDNGKDKHKGNSNGMDMGNENDDDDGTIKTEKEHEKVPDRALIDHFVMNLPGNAIDFLDAYRGIFTSLSESNPEFQKALKQRKNQMPMIHCYCFSATHDKNFNDLPFHQIEQDIFERAQETLGFPNILYKLKQEQQEKKKDDDLVSVTFVRDVAPRKGMYRLSFRLPEEVAYAKS